MLSIFGVGLVLYFVKILSGSKNYQVSFHVIKAIMSKSWSSKWRISDQIINNSNTVKGSKYIYMA
jgi:hypothetical protein